MSDDETLLLVSRNKTFSLFFSFFAINFFFQTLGNINMKNSTNEIGKVAK